MSGTRTPAPVQARADRAISTPAAGLAGSQQCPSNDAAPGGASSHNHMVKIRAAITVFDIM